MIQLNGFKFYLARRARNKARWACSTHHRYGCRAAILTVDDLITSLNQNHYHDGKGNEESRDKIEPEKREKIKTNKKNKNKNKHEEEIYNSNGTYEIEEAETCEVEDLYQTEKLILENVEDEIYEERDMYKVLHLDPDGESYIVELQ